MKRCLDLKVIVISATLDEQRYSCPKEKPASLLKVRSSAPYQVEGFYTKAPEPDSVEAAIRTFMFIHQTAEPGDILLFLTEIGESCRKIRIEAQDRCDRDPTIGPLLVVLLYSCLPLARQKPIFDPPTALKRARRTAWMKKLL